MVIYGFRISAGTFLLVVLSLEVFLVVSLVFDPLKFSFSFDPLKVFVVVCSLEVFLVL